MGGNGLVEGIDMHPVSTHIDMHSFSTHIDMHAFSTVICLSAVICLIPMPVGETKVAVWQSHSDLHML